MEPSKRILSKGLLSMSLFLGLSGVAEARSCAELGDDLRAMQKAQSSLLDSMVRKNESMASTLDQYAQTLSNRDKMKKSDVVSLKRSAQAFRNHESREGKLVERFQKKTDELLAQVEQCLRAKAIASK